MLTRQAITEMTRQLRNGKGRHGLVLANGGVLSYQHAVCLSSRPRDSPYPDSLRIAADSTDAPPVVEDASGPAVIEVSPSLGPLSCDIKQGLTPSDIYGGIQARRLSQSGVHHWSTGQRPPVRGEPRRHPDLESDGVVDGGTDRKERICEDRGGEESFFLPESQVIDSELPIGISIFMTNAILSIAQPNPGKEIIHALCMTRISQPAW